MLDEIVRRIYREYIAGYSITQIGKRLQRDGIKTKLGSERWHHSSLEGILTNEKYTGNAVLGKTFKRDVLSKQREKNDGRNSMDIKQQTYQLIDDLKAVCHNYGMGNDGNEYKVITQIFLYKFLNDKFGYEIKKKSPAIASAEKWELAYAEMSEDDRLDLLDEFAHILNAKGAALKTAIIESVADTVSLPIDTQETFPGQKRTMMRSHYAVGYYNAKVSDDTVARVDRMRKAFNSPFRPFVLSTTSIGQEGLDFHYYCRKVMHWNLPSNPIDLEQREGRINRFKCLAVRQNIAQRYGSEFSWDDMFAHAAADLKGDYPDLVPYWCLPDLDGESVKIERIVPMYPFSQDQLRYNRIIKILSLYRLTLGQPRQEELITILDKELAEVQDGDLFMNLSPFYHTS